MFDSHDSDGYKALRMLVMWYDEAGHDIVVNANVVELQCPQVGPIGLLNFFRIETVYGAISFLENLFVPDTCRVGR